MKNRSGQHSIRRDVPLTSAPNQTARTFPVSSALSDSEDSRRPARTANFHYARMRCAEDAARRISVRSSVGSVPAGELDAAKAVQTSYYLLAAAHRSAARRVERRDNRAQAWADFRRNPAGYARCTVRDWARSVRRTVRRMAESVSV